MAKQPELFDSEIFKDLMNHNETVLRICLGFSKNPWDAEELTQEVYLKAYRKISALHNSNLSREWLFRIARNTCLDHIKKKRLNRLFQFKSNKEAVEQNTPELQIMKNEQHQILKNAISQLPKKQKEVFVLKEYGYLSYKEIASTLGIKEGTVMSRLNRARQTLINQLKGIQNEQG